MPGMNPDELYAFLNRTNPPLLGVVGTQREDGWPHLVPVWYRFDGRAVHIWTHAERAWVRNCRRDDRVAFSVQEDRPPYAAAIMRGNATVASGDGAEISAEIRRITARYVAESGVDTYIAGWPGLRTIVTITPVQTASWVIGY